MPDIQEVYEMVTKQKPPEPGALERQQKRQVRTARNKKIGAFVVAAAIGVVAIVLILMSRPADLTTPAATPTVNPADAAAEGVAMGFLDAYGAFDAKTAMTYVAADADLTGLIDPQVPSDTKGLSLMLSWLKASGYEQTINSCKASTVASDTRVV
jgi:hypothetical protein